MKKVISFVLTAIMIISMLPISVLAAGMNETKITVDSTDAVPGERFSIDVNLENNPGIISASISVAFDDGLTLVGASNGDTFPRSMLFIPPKQLSTTESSKTVNITSSCTFAWSGIDIDDADIKDGTILTLDFMVSENAEIGTVYHINVTSRNSDIIDKDLNSIAIAPAQGKVTVIDYTPGDVDDNGLITMRDTTLISRYIVDGCMYDPDGYAVRLNEKAADVNDDGSITMHDTVLINRYIVDGCKTDPNGYNITLKSGSKRCSHSMTAFEAKEASCVEDGNIAYWYCENCKKYFADINGARIITLAETVITAQGHNVIVDPAVPATETSVGWTEGSHCDICKTVLVEQEEIPTLKVNSYNIIYHLWDNETDYLKAIELDNSKNPTTRACSTSLRLQPIETENDIGFEFLYWYQKGDDRATTVIEANTMEAGDTIHLYAKWKKNVYKVLFDSPDYPVDMLTYTVDTGIPLINPPKLFGYTFVGWSNDDGFLVNRIKPGTTGHITLHANWTSNRNKTTSYEKYAEPFIIEDNDNGQFLFIYDIGKIDNVPISIIDKLMNSDGIEIDNEYDVDNTVSHESAQQMAETVSNATTKSSAWTLSKDWNQIYEAGSESEEKKGKSEVRTDSEGNVTGGNYFVSNSTGGSTFVSSSSGGSISNSAKVTTDKSVGLNASYDNTIEKYGDAKLGIKDTTALGAEVSVPVKIAKVGASVKNTLEIGAEASIGRKDTTSVHADSSLSSHVGTYNESNSSAFFSSTVNKESNWNSTSGYEKSYQSSVNTELSKAISEEISNKTTYNVTDSVGGSEATNESDTTSTTKGNEYVNSVRVNEETKTSEKKHCKFSAKELGYYRLINAGTLHIFAVVGYDVATSSYYTYTYNVLDDERHPYLDFSLNDPNFKDCENGVVTFEVPIEVNEYIAGVTGKSEGLTISLDGTVTQYKGESDTVVIPQYDSADNHDNTYSAVKVRGITSSTFANNTDIKTVVLPLYITEIPDNAFKGCTNLETVIAFGVTKIGNNAFDGCVNLKKFSIDNKVTQLGTAAFNNVPEVMINAANVSVADNAVNCGAKKITLNISKVEGKYSDKEITVGNNTDCFALYSDGSATSNLRINSSAMETVINNIKFKDNEETPITVDSNRLTLNRVVVENAPGFALVLKNNLTNVQLYSVVKLESQTGNAVLSRSISLSNINKAVSCSLNASQNILVCGSFTDSESLLASGLVKNIDENTYNNWFSSSKITFDANMGSVAENSKTVYYGQKFGILPIPERQNYIFDGWYTSPEGGTKITAETIVEITSNMILYAHWTLNTYTLLFDATGGSVSETNRTATCDTAIGTLPTPTRTGFTFQGWYTAASDGTKVDSTSIFNSATTLYAHWDVNSFDISWNTGIGYSIMVDRTGSQYAGAITGKLSSGDTIYYGDTLSITYAASPGYSILSEGSTSISVTENITSSNIYCTVSANKYTYNIKYVSSNGTDLGSTTATYEFGTTNSISAPAKSGYNTPGAQSVNWDSTSPKTITFTYTPISQPSRQTIDTGSWWSTKNTQLNYKVEAEWRNRTANSIEIRIIWTNTITNAYNQGYYGYKQEFEWWGWHQIAAASAFGSPGGERTASVTSGWHTYSIEPGDTSRTTGSEWKDNNGKSGTWEGTIQIPKY